MKASDLIGCDVYDSDGIRLGRVHDLRFELSVGQGRPFHCELTGIDCGASAAVGHRLGYGTGDMAGPWPLSVLLTRYRRRSLQTIRWTHVAGVAEGRIRLRTTRSRLDQERSA